MVKSGRGGVDLVVEVDRSEEERARRQVGREVAQDLLRAVAVMNVEVDENADQQMRKKYDKTNQILTMSKIVNRVKDIVPAAACNNIFSDSKRLAASQQA